MQRLRDLDEAELLARLFPAYAAAPRSAQVAVGPGDDAAVLVPTGSVVLTTDSMVRGLDWLDEWSSPVDVGWKVAGQNLADVAAMGAVPTGLLVALAADPDTPVEWCVGLATGLAEASAQHGATVLGGDLSAAPRGVVIVAGTAVGDLRGRPAILRSGARPGDTVAVCGTLGVSGVGLALLHRAGRPGSWAAGHGAAGRAVRAHLRAPVPHLAAGHRAAGVATAMIDVSDGLLRDLGRLAAASEVVIDLDRSALASFATPLVDLVGADEAWRQVLGGGEEHALVATFPPGTDLGALSRGAATGRWGVIGEVAARQPEPNPGPATARPRVTVDGVDPGRTGWDHFGG